MKETSTIEKPVSLKNIIMYGVGDLYGGGSFLIVGTLFMIFLTDVVGIRPFLAGLVLIIGKIWDAVSDPLMGYISDNTRTRFGRRRIFFIIGIIPVILSFFALWFPINLESQLTLFLYYMFAYVLFSTVFTMMMVPYTALNAEMSTDYKIRTKISGSRIIFSQMSALISGVIPALIVNNAVDLKTGYMIMGLVFGLFYAFPWIFVFFGTQEVTFNEAKFKGSFSSIYKNFLTIFKNKSFKYHIIMYIFSYSAMDIMMALFIYYLTYYINKPEWFSLCLGSMLLTQIITLPFYVKLCNKKGKGFAYAFGLAIWSIAMLLLFFITPDTSALLITLISILIGSGLAGGVMVPWAILPSVVDVDELMTSKKRAGVYSGMMSFIRKIVQALILFIIGVLLDLFGYIPNLDQSETTISRIRLLIILGPVIMLIFGIIFSFKFKINPDTHRILTNETKRLKNGGKKENVDKETKEVCELLTGVKYDDLYIDKKN